MQLNDWVKSKDKEKNRYYGTVVDNNDPLKRNRVRIRIPELHKGVPDNLLPFFRPFKDDTSNTSLYVDVPAVGSCLEVGFEEEDFYNGVYMRGLSTTENVENTFYEGYPNFKGFKTSSGNTVKWYNNGTLEVAPSGSSLTIKNDSGMKIQTPDIEVTGNLVVDTGVSGSFVCQNATLIFTKGILTAVQ